MKKAHTITNPILSGFYPDPSICRVDKDFYLVTSSFSFFPGVPIFHSKDLAHWRQIGHVLDRPEQLPVSYHAPSAGIFAPTIRYHQGIYYVISTNMSLGGRNFIVTAKDPAGPWSAMHCIEGADGIDPSLFFDEDGTAYYTGTTRIKEGDGTTQAIWGSVIDIKTMQLVGERSILWKGALRNAYAPEAPHLYKKEGWYYLMTAEGGTEHYHSVNISRSQAVLGEYEGYQGNPILTHRHLGKLYPICNVGHGDLVALQDGSWYMVALGSRLMDGYHKILGRESFIAPVIWEDGWPVVSPGTGKIQESYPLPISLPPAPFFDNPFDSTSTDFDEKELGKEWNFLGLPKVGAYRLEDSFLKLQLLAQDIVPWELDGLPANPIARIQALKGKTGHISFVGRRQQHIRFVAETKLKFSPTEQENAGMVVLQNDANQIQLAVQLNSQGQKTAVCITVRTVEKEGKQHFSQTVEGAYPVSGDDIFLKVIGRGIHYSFYVKEEEHDAYQRICEGVDGGFLGSQASGGFIGAYLGLFACGGGQKKDTFVGFDWFRYGELTEQEDDSFEN